MAARRTIGVLASAGLVGLALAACAPRFDAGATLNVPASSNLNLVSWPAASESDEGQAVAQYRIDLDGVEIARVGADQRSCVLKGVNAANVYTVRVTAYDTAGEWSGDDAAAGSLTAQIAPLGSSGSVKGCVSPVDTDGDRLPDAFETATGTYSNIASTGTSPTTQDTDGDGIDDGDEVLGTTDGLELAAMGLRPTKKDILFEFDWFDDNVDPGDCNAHSHRPTAAAIAQLTAAYANAPVPNPDGSTGIKMVADYGQGGVFSGGNRVPDADGVIAGGVPDSDFRTIKSGHLAANRIGRFHYVLMPHRYDTTSNSGGQAWLDGHDMIVSLQCWNSTSNISSATFHEAGHNLGLHHGGDETVNYKPNYNSVMNYLHAWDGVDTNCTIPGDGVLDYSKGTRAPLNETALLETNGICGGVDIDWNANTVIDAAPVAVDINGDATLGVLRDHNDWGNIRLGSVTINNGDSPPEARAELITEDPLPPSARGD